MPHNLKGLAFLEILQGNNCSIEIYYFTMVNYTKVQFSDNSRHNNDEEDPKNVNQKSIINEFAAKKSRKMYFILFIIVYLTFKYYVKNV